MTAQYLSTSEGKKRWGHLQADYSPRPQVHGVTAATNPVPRDYGKRPLRGGAKGVPTTGSEVGGGGTGGEKSGKGAFHGLVEEGLGSEVHVTNVGEPKHCQGLVKWVPEGRVWGM